MADVKPKPAPEPDTDPAPGVFVATYPLDEFVIPARPGVLELRITSAGVVLPADKAREVEAAAASVGVRLLVSTPAKD